MREGDVINGYRALRDFTTAGGGMSKWTIAEKDGQEFFLKEFLSPTYPQDDGPGSWVTKQRKRERCHAFEAHQRSIVQALKTKCAPGGNVVYARDFFRYGTKYFKVTEMVDVSSMQVDDIARLPLPSRVLVLKTAAHSVGVLHSLGIVHGDLKPANLLIKRTAYGGATYVAKLIDFDNSFFSGHPPEDPAALVGDMVFHAPEVVVFIRGDPRASGASLQLASDVFSLAVVFCLYLTGKLPIFPLDKFRYPGEAARGGATVYLRSDALPAQLVTLVNRMLHPAADARPQISEVLLQLKELDPQAAPEGQLRGALAPTQDSTRTPASTRGPRTGRLRGRLVRD